MSYVDKEKTNSEMHPEGGGTPILFFFYFLYCILTWTKSRNKPLEFIFTNVISTLHAQYSYIPGTIRIFVLTT